MVQTSALFTLYDVLLRFRVFAVDVLRDSFIKGEGYHHLVVVGAKFCQLSPLYLPYIGAVQFLDLIVVQGHGKLLVLVVHEVVMILKPRLLLGFNHPLHKLHGRIVLSDIAFLFCLDDNFAEFLRVRFELDGKFAGRSLGDVHLLLLVTHTREGKCGTIDACNGEFAVQVGYGGNLSLLVGDASQGKAVTSGGIKDDTSDSLS